MTIRNDATRQRVPVRDPRPLRSVVARQGQVLLDTDINEAAQTLLDRIERTDAAMLGPADRLLYPVDGDGFAVGGTATAPTIAAGTGYLDGWQMVNPAAVTLSSQPNPWQAATASSPVAVVLKALVRHVDPVEDDALADVALGDAQASGRALNDWQVFVVPVPEGTDCADIATLDRWQALTTPSMGTLAFHVAVPPASADPCSLAAAGGHSRFENLLYRIEVHGGSALAEATAVDGPRFGMAGLTLKLSRRNASLMVRITQIAENRITVSPPALDPRAWFAQGAFAEIVGRGDDIDPVRALAAERLFKVALASDEQITLSATAAQIAASGATADGTWYLRLWDAWPGGAGIVQVPAGGGPIDLGDGIAITLAGDAAATFRRGDYWTAAVRADGTIAWPGIAGGMPEQQPPHGPERRYAPLAIIDGENATDCRIPFATLSDRALLYRGGDGQEASAPEAGTPTPVPLLGTLRVAVMRGATPVPGARIRWQMPTDGLSSWIEGTDLAAAPFEAETGPDGLAEVRWAIDAQRQDARHAVEAVLLNGSAPADTPPVQFGARFATAAQTSFRPGKCPTLSKSATVQEALDALCAALGQPDTATLRLRRITLLGAREQPLELIRGRLILNALEVDPVALSGGIRFEFGAGRPRNGPLRAVGGDADARGIDTIRGSLREDPVDGLGQRGLALGIEPYDPVAEIAIDLPYPLTVQDGYYWLRRIDGGGGTGQLKQWGSFGFTTMRLDGTVTIEGDAIVWKPTDFARIFLLTAARHRFGSGVQEGVWQNRPLDRVLCRIRLRSALIFADDPDSGDRLWLNAEHLGTRDKATARELLLGVRDTQKAADLDMFIYLAPPEPGIIFYFPKGSAAPDRSNLGTVEEAMKAAIEQWQAQPSGVLLASYADDPGAAAYNLKLSEQRATTIRDALAAQGVAADAMTTQAFGDTQAPHPPASPNAEQSRNRRVVVTFGGGYKP